MGISQNTARSQTRNKVLLRFNERPSRRKMSPRARKGYVWPRRKRPVGTSRVQAVPPRQVSLSRARKRTLSRRIGADGERPAPRIRTEDGATVIPVLEVGQAENQRQLRRCALASAAAEHSVAESSPRTVALAKKLARYPFHGQKRSLRDVAAELEAAGYVTSTGTCYGAAAVARMIC